MALRPDRRPTPPVPPRWDLAYHELGAVAVRDLRLCVAIEEHGGARSLGAWGEVFGDPVIATAILDRLLHHSITVNIRGESYRLREKLKAGLLKPKIGAAAEQAYE